MMKASEMTKGQRGIIQDIHLAPADKKRLFYLGIYQGGCLTMLQKAPWKDPILYFAQGNQIILRKKDAQLIEVEVKP